MTADERSQLVAEIAAPLPMEHLQQLIVQLALRCDEIRRQREQREAIRQGNMPIAATITQ